MNKKIVATWVSLAMVLSFIVIIEIAPTVSAPTTIYVGSGMGNDSATINGGISLAQPGDTVYVYNGTYNENVVVGKTINLTGENRNTTIIDSGGSGNVVVVNANWVNITGFTITNSGSLGMGETYGGLKLRTIDNKVYNNNVSSNNGIGIYLDFSNKNNITNNLVNSNGLAGILLWESKQNNIAYNDLSFNIGEEGIVLRSSSNNNNITNNTANNNGYGIYLSSSFWNTIVDNKASFNTFQGIYLDGSNFNLIENNSIKSSPGGNGLFLHSSMNNNISYNNIINNGYDGIVLYELSNYNNVFNNTVSSNSNRGIYLGGASALSGSKYNYIANNTITSNLHGMYFGETCNYNTIKNNNISSNNDMGMHLVISSWNNITDNNVSSNAQEGIYLNSGSNRNNILENTFILNERGIVIGDSGLNNIENNSLHLNSRDGIHLRNSDDNFISNNTASSNWYGIYIRAYSIRNTLINNNLSLNIGGIYLTDHSDDNTLTQNNVSYNGIGIELNTFCNNIIFINNSISFSIEYGIFLAGSEGDTLINNTMVEDGIMILGGSVSYWNSHEIGTSNTVNGKPVYYWKNQTTGEIPQGAGEVLLANCTNITVKNQDVSNGTVGIEIGFCSNINIIENNASNNFIGFYGYESYDCDIVKNMVMKNDYGIVVASGSNENNVTLNTVAWNECGIYATWASFNNTIHHNDIINNTVQAQDVTNNDNRWDNGYPSGGNYWSDFDEPGEGAYDDYYGIDQNILGSDGIVDNGTIAGGGLNPYVIDANSQDNYPLIEPVYFYMILKQGWNLISLPSIQKDQTLINVLGSIDGMYDAVQWYDITDPVDPWKHYRPGKPYGNDLSQINETMGFWIHITQPGDTFFICYGVKPTSNQNITILPGWNLVGYPSLKNYDRTLGLNNLTFNTHVNSIWTYNATTQKWKELGPSDYFERGRGYWVHALNKCEWEVPL